MERVEHTFAPVYNSASRILIVGTMPSVQSRQHGFYYGNPRNRFYDVLCTLLGAEKPETVEQKRDLLLDCRIAVYDVLHSCEIHGSSDASIKDAVPNDFSPIFNAAHIKCVFANGKTAYRYYTGYIGKAVALPSTSPANAAWDLKRLADAWAVILEYL